MTMLCGLTGIDAGALTPPAEAPPQVVEMIPCGSFSVNCYIVSQGGKAILVDTGEKAYRDEILEKCKAANVQLIVLTHGHYDHAQNAAYLSEQLRVPVAMHAADLGQLEELEIDKAHTLFGGMMVASMYMLKFLYGNRLTAGVIEKLIDNRTPIFVPDVLLKEGDSLAAYGVDAEIVALPGHTLGSIGVLAGDDLIAGDALMHILWPMRSAHYIDRTAMEASAGKISGLGDVTVWFGHGKPVANRSW